MSHNCKFDVTIIIVNYNTRELTFQCLKSVFAETRKASFEVIVVDNASEDGSAQMIAEHFPHVMIIANKENRGFAAANNQALKTAGGRYALLLNSDTIVLEAAIDKCIEYADAHPDIGALGPKVLWPSGNNQSSVFRFPSLLDAALDAVHAPYLLPYAWANRVRYEGSDWDKVLDVDVVAGCFLMVRSEAIHRVGCLDEDFFMYGEEAEWCYRIKRAGWRIQYFPGARIIHIKGASTEQEVVSPKANLARRLAHLLVLEKNSWNPGGMGWQSDHDVRSRAADADLASP